MSEYIEALRLEYYESDERRPGEMFFQEEFYENMDEVKNRESELKKSDRKVRGFDVDVMSVPKSTLENCN